jgi:hypothetical protein
VLLRGVTEKAIVPSRSNFEMASDGCADEAAASISVLSLASIDVMPEPQTTTQALGNQSAKLDGTDENPLDQVLRQGQ